VTAAWNSSNYSLRATGKGVTIAVLDSGYRAHPDMDPNLVTDPSKAKSGGVSPIVVSNAGDADDPNGHGTHVIGIINGADALGRYVGVAPEARVISVKVANAEGGASESDLLRGLLWVYLNRQVYNIRVVNLSMSAAVANSYRTSLLAAAVEILWRTGVVVVTAAGNLGSVQDAVWYGPGNDPFAITVGALDDNLTAGTADNCLASFSSRGTTQDGFAKPDIVAPGRKIVSTLAASSRFAQQYPDRVVDGRYIRMSGTSMAVPVISGVVALLLEKFPGLTPDQVKWLLTSTAVPYPGMSDGAGLVHAEKALQRAALGNLGMANAGIESNPVATLIAGILNGTINPADTTSYWDSSYWDASYWDSSYWDSSYWDASYWDSSYWDASYWETGVRFDTSYWD
jgi:serine protease AprX